MEMKYLYYILTNAEKELTISLIVALEFFLFYCSFRLVVDHINNKKSFCLFDACNSFLWIMFTILILVATGLIGGEYGVTSPFDGSWHVSFMPIDSLSWATIFNIVLFVPFGFFTTLRFSEKIKSFRTVMIIGLGFSLIIEFTQSFLGRFCQVEDLIMNTLGAVIGYFICIAIIKISNKLAAPKTDIIIYIPALS